ncbi:MAG: RNA polymerase sigma factor RpoD/SigA [Bacteroidaceae bacterium]|jgi:RNA polymerase primary sigma factor|nr:RNA polymerase sigma factor RpoD/SigA [Bacteroidaceae bacterium]
MYQLKIAPSITNREGEALERYLQDIGRAEMISPEEEVELSMKIQRGDQMALSRLVRANLRFVVSVAKQYQSKGLGLIDIINEGNVGLIKAAQRFDHTRGFKFISYAVWWIRQSILQAITEKSRLVRLPSNQEGLMSKVKRFRNHFMQENQREPNAQEIATALEVEEEKVMLILDTAIRPISMDAPISENDDTAIIDLITSNDTKEATDSELESESLSTQLSLALAQLPEREQNILKMSFGIAGPERTLDEIAGRIGLSKERVRQLKEKAIRTLQLPQSKEILRSYI